jgi:tRNA(Phe) wybutosine-synthesizing methylase Tyw3
VKPSRKPAHASKSIHLKKCDVDEEIVYIIQWINAHPDALTFASCEGEEAVPTEADPLGRINIQQPYVLWICLNQFQLANIIRTLKAETEIKWNDTRGCLVYITRWKDKNALREEVEHVQHFGTAIEW